MRVTPDRPTEHKITGGVITLMDFGAQKQSRTSLQSTEKQLSMARQAGDAQNGSL